MCEYLLTRILRRPDDGRVRTETCSLHLLTRLLWRPDDDHIKTETCSYLF
jgi:hypothetical protein